MGEQREHLIQTWVVRGDFCREVRSHLRCARWVGIHQKKKGKPCFKLNEEGKSLVFLKALLTRCVLGGRKRGEEA